MRRERERDKAAYDANPPRDTPTMRFFSRLKRLSVVGWVSLCSIESTAKAHLIRPSIATGRWLASRPTFHLLENNFNRHWISNEVLNSILTRPFSTTIRQRWPDYGARFRPNAYRWKTIIIPLFKHIYGADFEISSQSRISADRSQFDQARFAPVVKLTLLFVFQWNSLSTQKLSLSGSHSERQMSKRGPVRMVECVPFIEAVFDGWIQK